MLHFGIITDIDAENGRGRVQFPDLDGMVSNWLPISVPKILNDKYSIPMDVNEPVWCIMDENCENGIIGGAYPNKNALPDGANKDKIRVKFNGSLSVEFDHSTSTLSIEGNGKININISQECSITAPLTKISGPLEVDGVITAGGIETSSSLSGGGTGDMSISGKLTVTGDIETSGGDVKAGSVDLKTHVHSGVQTGGGSSGPPI